MDKPVKENVVTNYLSRIHHHDTDITLVDDAFLDEHLFHIAVKVPWYVDIANYIVANKTPTHFSYKERNLFIQKSFHFSWIDNLFFYTGPDQVMRRCVRDDETYDILHACHNEPCRGHFAAKRTTFKILTTGYYWPTLYKDAVNYTRKCDQCQRMGQPIRNR